MGSIALSVERNVALLRQGRSLVLDLPDDAYREMRPGSTAESVGGHMRHVLDFYACFVHGLPAGRIDYDARLRDGRVEQDRRHAAAVVDERCVELSRVAAIAASQSLVVRCDADPGESDDGFATSTAGRELQILLSHTVHHYALMASLLRQWQIDVPPDFGVAPATLAHWRNL